jgi:hypothetical protein
MHQLYLQYFNLNFDRQPPADAKSATTWYAAQRQGAQGQHPLDGGAQGNDPRGGQEQLRGHRAHVYPLTHVLQCPHVLT